MLSQFSFDPEWSFVHCPLSPNPRLAATKIAGKSCKILMFASCCDIVPTSDGRRGGTSSAGRSLRWEAAGGTGNLGRLQREGAVITIDGFRMGGGGVMLDCCPRCKHYYHTNQQLHPISLPSRHQAEKLNLRMT